MENEKQDAKVVAPTTKTTTDNVIQLRNNTITQKELLFMLKQTFPALTQNEWFYAVSQCKAFGLDPRKKEIYFVPFNSKNGCNIASITSYEVYARDLEDAGYDFIPEWSGDKDIAHPENLMIKAKVVYKNTGRVRYETPWISIKEYAKMDYKKTELVGMWKQYPSLMLEKCVLVRASRFVLGKNMGYTAEELYNAQQYNIGKTPEEIEKAKAREKAIAISQRAKEIKPKEKEFEKCVELKPMEVK